MKTKIYKISVIGDGGWGTTLSIHLAKKGFPVYLWGAFTDNIERLKASGRDRIAARQPPSDP